MASVRSDSYQESREPCLDEEAGKALVCKKNNAIPDPDLRI